MIEKIEQIFSELKGVQEAHDKLANTLGGGPASYYLEKLATYIDGLFSFAKFKVGDSVCLRKNVDPIPCGWTGCAHFLVRDEPATIKGIDYRKNGFCYEIEFRNETWVDSKGKEQPVSQKHVFLFGENDLKKLATTH